MGLAVLCFSRHLRCPKVSKGRAESPLVRPQAHTPCPRRGMTRRLRRGSGVCNPMGSRQLRSEGFQRASGKPFGAPAGAHPLPRVGIDAPTAARERGLQPYGFLASFGPKVSKGRAESPLVRPQAHTPCPGWGLMRRLRRGSRACSPMGRSHFSFGGERKVCKRKPAARRLRRRPTSLCAVGFGLR